MMTKKKSKIANHNNNRTHKPILSSLNEEDYLLWRRVAASVHPLSSKKQEKAAVKRHISRVRIESSPDLTQKATAIVVPSSPSLSQPPQRKREKFLLCRKNIFPTESHLPIPDILQSQARKAKRKIARQHFDYDSSIDLHGLDQNSAYARLLYFIRSNVEHNQSLILVITGKGRSMGSSGILRQLVPQWLTTPPFRPYVSGIEMAARHHGGEGAFYVKLRKNT